ncbi:unnamed protein product [Adineta steineri]|uniref:Calponin-homology (CH) domain-containing protein n=2 Tax=Adineta steineri TaxID=433720 RepID=A0A818LRZ1_9BILA|nr:unnamed protein product [Adineta steineri]
MVTTRRSFVDEREDIQKKAFTKWINNQLANSNSTPIVTDLFQDLRDGLILLRLLEILTQNEYKREIGKMRVHHIGNVNKVIAVLGEYGIKLLSISSNDIVDGNPKLTLALIWSIIQYWQGKDVLKSVVSNPQQTNVEKFLLGWCQQQTKGYKGVVVKDFTSSWQDGLAFNALIHKFRPDLFDYEDILQNAAARNLEHAFNIAKTIFKIDRYLDVEDVLSEYPDKKSILMYVMCLFQQLPMNITVIEDKEKNGISTTKIPMNTRNISKETKSPSPSKTSPKYTSVTNSTMTTESRTPLQSSQLTTYQTNMERLVQWILKLEEQLDKEEKISTVDLKYVKEQFQKHEDFMISLTKDQNQIGQVLEEGNRLLSSPDINLQSREENEIKEQMKILNRRWESLRSKALDRQSLQALRHLKQFRNSRLHKMLMKLQIDQIESFDTWLTQAEQSINKQLEKMEEDLVSVDRQYRHLAQLQDELVAQQQITESLQNMVIVIDDTTINGVDTPASKYTSAEIEGKLLNLSERWASICTFVQNRWIQLQEVKIELEQVELNQEKVNRWITRKEDEVTKMIAETNISDTDILMQQVHSIKKTELEMDDIRQSILALDNSLKVLSTHYDSKTSKQLQTLNETINTFEKRWRQLLDNLEQCSARLKKSPLNFETSVKTNIRPNSDTVEKTITTIVEETTIKKRKIDIENSLKHEFDLSARKFLDWIDSIERILAAKETNNLKANERKEIVKEVKNKYISYDDQFKALLQTGNTITKEFKDAKEDSTEHEASLRTLEIRWQSLYNQIIQCERDAEQFINQTEFDEEFQTLMRERNEYQTWIDVNQSTSSTAEMQVRLKRFESFNDRLTKLQHMADRIDTNSVQRTKQLLRLWDQTSSRLREGINRDKRMPQPSGSTNFGMMSPRHGGASAVPLSPTRTGTNEPPLSSPNTGTAPMGSNVGSSTNENGNLFTLTNIYTFGDNGHSNINPSTDNYRIKSFVEVFDQPSTQQETEYERHYRETHSSSSITRKIHTNSSDTYDYDSSRFHHHFDSTNPLSTKHITGS